MNFRRLPILSSVCFPLVLAAILTAMAPTVQAVDRYQPANQDALLEQWFAKQIEFEIDDSRRITKLDQMLKDKVDPDFLPWAYLTLHETFLRLGNCDGAIRAGEKLLALKPDDLIVAHACGECAEKKKDSALVRLWADRSAEIARRLLASSSPDAQALQDLAKQILAYNDYLAYVEILQAAEPKKKLALIEQFLHERPDSQYAGQVSALHFQTYKLTGDQKGTVALAEKLLERDPDNEDAILVVAEGLFVKEQQPDRVLTLAGKLAEIVDAKPRPDSMNEADWSRRKNQFLSRAWWMIGRVNLDRGQFAQAERALRAALPLMRANEGLAAAALFHLGWANYKIGNLTEAVRFTQQCLLYKSQFAEQARKNLEAMRLEMASR